MHQHSPLRVMIDAKRTETQSWLLLPAGMRLVAYVVPALLQSATPETRGQHGSADLQQALLGWCKERLPAAAVPTCLMLVPSLPLTSSGKVAKQELPPPPFASPQPATQPSTGAVRGTAAGLPATAPGDAELPSGLTAVSPPGQADQLLGVAGSTQGDSDIGMAHQLLSAGGTIRRDSDAGEGHQPQGVAGASAGGAEADQAVQVQRLGPASQPSEGQVLAVFRCAGCLPNIGPRGQSVWCLEPDSGMHDQAWPMATARRPSVL